MVAVSWGATPMIEASAHKQEHASPWAWALFVASSAFALAAAGLLGFMA
jgi:hypothetical protein